MRLRIGIFVGFIALLYSINTSAHEVRPGYLEIKETAAETYDVFWKVPGRGDMRLGLYVKVPPNCKPTSLLSQYGTGDAFIERWTLKCDGGLAGKTISIEGLSSTMTDVLVQLQRLNGTIQTTRLTASSPSFVIEAVPNKMQVARTYVVLGFEHILTGIDHLLFVFGLLLLVQGFGRLVKTVSAFTVAHSVTLSLATLGFVNIPPPPVEVIIALSIVFVAREILMSYKGHSSLAQRKPWLIAFAFGLLHGLGFAGGLSAAGLPAGHIPLALLFFSIGVEIGHFSFIVTVLSILSILRRLKLNIPSWVRFVPPYAIGALAMFWVIQRISTF